MAGVTPEVGLFSKIQSLFNDKTFSDVEFICEDETKFYGHRLILALRSDHFASKFYENGQLVQQIKVPSSKKDLMYSLLRFLYTDKLDFKSIKEAQDLLSLAEEFRVKELEFKCFSYLLNEKTTIENIFPKYECSINKNVDVLNACRTFVCQNAEEILKTSSFKCASLEIVEDIISQDNLSVSSELIVLLAVMNWGQARCVSENTPLDDNSLKQCIHPLLKHIRFVTLTDIEFENFLEKYNIFNGSECFKLTKKILQPHLSVIIPDYICKIDYKRGASNVDSELKLKKFEDMSGDLVIFNESKETVSPVHTNILKEVNPTHLPLNHFASNQANPTFGSSDQVNPTHSTSNQVNIPYDSSNQVNPIHLTSDQDNQPYDSPNQVNPTYPISNEINSTYHSSNQVNSTYSTSDQINPSSSQVNPTHPTSNQVNPPYDSSNQVNPTYPTLNEINSTYHSSNQVNTTYLTSNQINLSYHSSNQVNPLYLSSNQVNPSYPTSNQVNSTNNSSNQVNPTYNSSNQLNPIYPTTNQVNPADLASKIDLTLNRSTIETRNICYKFCLIESESCLDLSFKKDVKCSVTFLMKRGNMKLTGLEMCIRNLKEKEMIDVEVEFSGFASSFVKVYKKELKGNYLFIYFEKPLVLTEKQRSTLEVSIDELICNRCGICSVEKKEINNGVGLNCELSIQSSKKVNGNVLFLINRLFFTQDFERKRKN